MVPRLNNAEACLHSEVVPLRADILAEVHPVIVEDHPLKDFLNSVGPQVLAGGAHPRQFRVSLGDSSCSNQSVTRCLIWLALLSHLSFTSLFNVFSILSRFFFLILFCLWVHFRYGRLIRSSLLLISYGLYIIYYTTM